jgi:membrane protease YdiL (CAAX protease family)
VFQDQEPLPAPPPATGFRLWRGRDIGLAVLLLAAGYLGVIAALLILTLGRGPQDGGIPLSVALATLGFEVWLALVVVIVAARRAVPFSALGLETPPRWGLALLCVLLAYVAMAIYTTLVLLVEEVAGGDLGWLREGNPLPSIGESDALVWAVLGVSVVGVAPLAEELFFRGFLFRALAERWGAFLGAVTSGLAFSLVHFNVSVVIPFAAIGVIFAWAFRRSGSLWTVIVAHAIVNGASFTVALSGVTQ